jgi:hypothetical protein
MPQTANRAGGQCPLGKDVVHVISPDVTDTFVTLHIVVRHSRARGVARAVLNVLAYHIDTGDAWPSVQTLATEAGCSLRAARNAVHALVGLREITVISRAGGPAMTPRLRTNLYRITLRCPDGCCTPPELDPWDVEADQ